MRAVTKSQKTTTEEKRERTTMDSGTLTKEAV